MVNAVIVDDDEALLEVVCLMVKAGNMRATGKKWAEKLSHRFQENGLAQFLWTFYPGSHDGRELARQIKKDERFHHFPVLLCSAGNITPGTIEQSLADDFFRSRSI